MKYMIKDRSIKIKLNESLIFKNYKISTLKSFKGNIKTKFIYDFIVAGKKVTGKSQFMVTSNKVIYFCQILHDFMSSICIQQKFIVKLFLTMLQSNI